MALINCPECGKEISDKVKACPHCGFPLSQDTEQDQVSLPQQVEVTGVKINNSKLKKSITTIGIFLVIAIIAFFSIRSFNEKKAQKEYELAFNSYIDDMLLIQLKMISGGSEAESLINLTYKTWSNAIYEDKDPETDRFTRPKGLWVDDFNIALSNLYSDSSTKYNIGVIESNQKDVKELMKSLQNPPTGLENCYTTITELYTAYKGLTDLAVSPSGSLKSFGETKNLKVREFLDAYEKLTNQIPEKFPIEE